MEKRQNQNLQQHGSQRQKVRTMEKRGFSLPPTTSKPPMPPVKPPKKEGEA